MLVLHMKVDKVSDEEGDKVAKGTLVTLVSQVNLGRVGGSNSRSCSCTFCILQDLHIARAHVATHVLARVETHVLVQTVDCNVLARVVKHVLARVLLHVLDYYSKTCVQD